MPPNYVIFAHVTKGLEVVDALASVETTMGPGGEGSIADDVDVPAGFVLFAGDHLRDAGESGEPLRLSAAGQPSAEAVAHYGCFFVALSEGEFVNTLAQVVFDKAVAVCSGSKTRRQSRIVLNADSQLTGSAAATHICQCTGRRWLFRAEFWRACS